MIRLLVTFLLLALPLCLPAQADVPKVNTTIKIPAPIKGNLVVYRVGHTQCSMFISDAGMAKGTVQPSCVLLPTREIPLNGGYKFEIIDVITTTGN